MGVIGASFGAASIAVFGLSFLSAKAQRQETTILSGMILGTWAVTNAAHGLLGQPASWLINPPMDMVCLMLTMSIWYQSPRIWKLALAFTFFTQSICHVLFWTQTLWTGEKPSHLYEYVLALNILFAMQLCCASWPGASNAVVISRRWLLYRFGSRARPVPSARR